MEMTMVEHIENESCFNPIYTEAFICEGDLYNASYIPTDDSATTIMLERVIKYPQDRIYYKNKINMILITVINATRIRIDLNQAKEKQYEMALACATAAYQFNLTRNYVTVDIADISIPIHISSSNR